MLSPGDVVDGRFRVERLIGEGGMGAVYAVQDTDGRPFALKVLLDATSEMLTKRFLREATASAQLSSDNVAKIYSSGALADGTPYLLMELLVGEDLSDFVHRQGPLSTRQAIDALLPVLDALKEAHGIGMVHRDIKPANLFRTTLPDGSFRVKLLDFGISKPALTGVAPVTQLTQTGTILGSPEYMAPEQLVSSSDVDARADVWALGVTLHELLTGSTAFAGDTLAEIVTAIMRDPPRPLREHHPELPEQLEAIIKRCLEKDPDRRFSSVSELAEALRAIPATPFETAQTMVGHAAPNAIAHAATVASVIPPAPLVPAATASAPVASPAVAPTAAPVHSDVAAAAPSAGAVDARRAPTVVRAPPPAPAVGTAPSATPSKRRLWPLAVAALFGLVVLGAVLIVAGRARSSRAAASAEERSKKKTKKSKKEGESSKEGPISKADRKRLKNELKLALGKLVAKDFDGAATVAQGVVDEVTGEHGLQLGRDHSEIASDACHVRAVAFVGKAHALASDSTASVDQLSRDIPGWLAKGGKNAAEASFWNPESSRCTLAKLLGGTLVVADTLAKRAQDPGRSRQLAGSVVRLGDGMCTSWKIVPRQTQACAEKQREVCAKLVEVLKRIDESRSEPDQGDTWNTPQPAPQPAPKPKRKLPKLGRKRRGYDGGGL